MFPKIKETSFLNLLTIQNGHFWFATHTICYQQVVSIVLGQMINSELIPRFKWLTMEKCFQPLISWDSFSKAIWQHAVWVCLGLFCPVTCDTNKTNPHNVGSEAGITLLSLSHFCCVSPQKMLNYGCRIRCGLNISMVSIAPSFLVSFASMNFPATYYQSPLQNASFFSLHGLQSSMQRKGP